MRGRQTIEAAARRFRFLLPCLALAGCSATPRDSASIAQVAQSIVGAPATAVSVDLTVNQVGRLSTQGNGVFRTYHEYDALGRGTKTQHVIGDTSYLYTTTYGNPGGGASASGPVVVGSTFPDGEQVAVRYDAAWAVQAISTQGCAAYDASNQCTAHATAQTIVDSIKRNARGQTLTVVHGDGTTSTHVYNDQSDLQLHRLETALGATPAVVLQLFEYTYDANGNITSVSDYCNETTTSGCSASTPNSTFTANYTYDKINQLVGGTWTYGYDDFGNLINKEGKNQCYGTGCGVSGARGPHALARDGANLTYQYDANGNLSSRSDGLAISWNAVNLPVATTGGPLGTAITQKYFLETSLTKKAEGGATIYYLPEMRVENGAAIKYFSGFAERSADGTLKFYHDDRLGSSTLVTDASGNVVHRQAYTPYGEDRVANPPGAFTVATGLRYQFNFKELETDGSNFYDYGARLYNPASGRWLSPDDDTTDGLNRYAYVGNNPLRYADPTGHSKLDTAQHVLGGVSAFFGIVTLACPVCAPVTGTIALVAGLGSAGISIYKDVQVFRDPNATRRDKVIAGVDAAVNVVLSAVDLGELASLRSGASAVRSGASAARQEASVARAEANVVKSQASAVRSTASATSKAGKRIGATGDVGEKWLEQLGGTSQKYFKTTKGGRFVDQQVGAIAHESKVGYMKLSKEIRTQIAKDILLRRSRKIDGVAWHFFRSPVTGVRGPAAPLRKKLIEHGITIVLHK